MKLSRKAIAIIMTVVISLVCLGIAAKFVMAYLLLPEEKQSISFYKQCYASGGTIKGVHGSQCGGTCWDEIQLGVQNCGYGAGLFADCFCGEGRCWDDATGGCVSQEEYAKHLQ